MRLLSWIGWKDVILLLYRLMVRGNMVTLLQAGLEKLLHWGQKYLSTISLQNSMKINEFHIFRLLEHCMSLVL
ncbi:unnamed protein product [Staurois parvus]|uniref:Maturase K n=1 Tax=Staurois parvus TaxID=386267 RepID=A0ABN9C4P6_9NEOB|nr:unnamed protein product [Staurois parvus]